MKREDIIELLDGSEYWELSSVPGSQDFRDFRWVLKGRDVNHKIVVKVEEHAIYVFSQCGDSFLEKKFNFEDLEYGENKHPFITDIEKGYLGITDSFNSDVTGLFLKILKVEKNREGIRASSPEENINNSEKNLADRIEKVEEKLNQIEESLKGLEGSWVWNDLVARYRSSENVFSEGICENRSSIRRGI